MPAKTFQRSASGAQLRSGRHGIDKQGPSPDPGIPRFYFYRSDASQKEPPRKGKSFAKNRGQHQETLTSTGRSLRGAGGSMLRSASGPMLLTRLAEDLAPPDTVQVSNQELPPGILDCRNRLEAFRVAAVEAISMEALMSIHNKTHPLQVENVSSKDDRQGKARSDASGHITDCGDPSIDFQEAPPGVQECKRSLNAFMAEVARAKMMQAETRVFRD